MFVFYYRKLHAGDCKCFVRHYKFILIIFVLDVAYFVTEKLSFYGIYMKRFCEDHVVLLITIQGVS